MSDRPALTLYGIPNCDTVKKARAWLADAGIEVRFHDLRKDGVPHALLNDWILALGAGALINRRGTTWRRLDAAQQALADSASGALLVMQAEPSVIKRPVVDWGDGLTVGFDAADWAVRAARVSGKRR